MTGELRLESPTVAQEVAWGIHFFDDALFDAFGVVHDALAHAAAAAFPGMPIDVPVVLEFGSWIGGDRDGNPNVTPAVTRQAIQEYRRACFRRYRARLADLVTSLSIAERSIAVPAWFRAAFGAAARAVGDAGRVAARNPGELFRQWIACMQDRLAATAGEASPAPPYAAPDEMIAELRQLERALGESRCGRIADRVVAPVRREVEGFRFSLVRLDVRDHARRLRAAAGDRFGRAWSRGSGRCATTIPRGSAPRSPGHGYSPAPRNRSRLTMRSTCCARSAPRGRTPTGARWAAT